MRNDKIYTPKWLVNKMLDLASFNGEQIWGKTILEPSFGEGAFLIEIVSRIIDYAKISNKSEDEIYDMLSNIYGVELEQESYDITMQSLNNFLALQGLTFDKWNLYCDNTLVHNFNIKFDYIFANPPYVRVHNMTKEERKQLKTYSFSDGIPDLYIVFMEYCLDILNENGKMIFITPNNFYFTKSQQAFRNYLCESGYLSQLINYGHIKIFNGINVYTTISVFEKRLNDNNYLNYINMLDKDTVEYERNIELSSLINKEFIIHNQDDEDFLKSLYNKQHKVRDYCKVLNAIQTNANSLYVGDFANKMESGILKKVIKASDLGKKQGCVDIIFPYIYTSDNTYRVMTEDELKTNYPLCYAYLLSIREKLENRNIPSTNTEWFQYGRSQGISNMLSNKLVFKKYISKSDNFCNIVKLDENTFVYSGIFIVSDKEEQLQMVYNILKSKEFCRYCKLVGKNLTGGYKEITGNMISNYPVD